MEIWRFATVLFFAGRHFVPHPGISGITRFTEYPYFTRNTMFDFFKRKPKPIQCTDIVWMTGAEKQQGFLELLKDYPDSLVMAWFPETQKLFQNCLAQCGLAHTVHLAKSGTAGGTYSAVLFLEHHPVLTKEQEVLEQFASSKILFVNSLDEPLLRLFDGEKIVQMLRRMGHQEGESVSHHMISSSIRKAQENVEKKVGFTLTHYAQSAEEWFAKYLKNE